MKIKSRQVQPFLLRVSLSLLLVFSVWTLVGLLWQHMETQELGYILITRTDSFFASILSFFIARPLFNRIWRKHDAKDAL